MERRFKERLVGATVLVVTMIVVVPLFLDGPAHNQGDPSGTVVESMSLPPAEKRPHVIQLDAQSPTAPARAAAPATADNARDGQAPAPASKPPPVSRSPAASVEGTKPEPAPAKPVIAPPAAIDMDSGWAVQVGSFSSEKNARGLAEDLRDRKYSAFHVRKNINGRILFRVLIGPEQDRERADALALRLKADGLPTTIVRHP